MLANFHKKTGFTLIELMVVIGIIGILSTIVYASFDEARKQSRDKIRMSSLKELQLAVELYRAQNGRYPAACAAGAGGFPVTPGPVIAATTYRSCDIYIVGLVPDFIPALPKDPNQENEPNKGIVYLTDDDGTLYKLGFKDTVESSFVTSFDDQFARCPAQTAATAYNPDDCSDLDNIRYTYSVYSLGAEDF